MRYANMNSLKTCLSIDFGIRLYNGKHAGKLNSVTSTRGEMDRVTYSTTIFGYAKELELSYSDDELSERLADHFEKGI